MIPDFRAEPSPSAMPLGAYALRTIFRSDPSWLDCARRLGSRVAFAIVCRVVAWPRLFVLLVGLTCLLQPSGAQAAEVKRAPRIQIEREILVGFSEAERAKILGYQSVTHASTFDRSGRKVMSGISYQLVDMKAAELFALLQRVDHTLPRALPATHKARYVGNFGEFPLVQLVHGNGFFNGTYTVIWQPHNDRKEVTFWMAPEHPHDVDDIWGFFRITPVDKGRRSLVTVAVAVDLGKGGVKTLYQGTVQKVILKSARYIRKFVDRRQGKNVD